MTRKICIFTGTRAEYGLLSNLIRQIDKDPDTVLQLIVSGSHLSDKHGQTYRNIEADGHTIDAKIPILENDNASIGEIVGKATALYTQTLTELKPDILVLLGDRFELLAASTAALFLKLPVAHIHGGELTLGALDDSIRHAITKMSHVHFASTKQYQNRIIQMGEPPSNVFSFGAPGVENIHQVSFLEKKEIEDKFQFKFKKKNLLITFHPVTVENNTALKQIGELLTALDRLQDTQLVFTMPNADQDGELIFAEIENYVGKNKDKSIAFKSMGYLGYLSTLKLVDGVIGNSSSGIIEAPSLNKGTINIGDRQKGRTAAKSVINCKPNSTDITSAIQHMYSLDFQKTLLDVKNPYEGKNTSKNILNVLKTIPLTNITTKSFYDLKESNL